MVLGWCSGHARLGQLLGHSHGKAEGQETEVYFSLPESCGAVTAVRKSEAGVTSFMSPTNGYSKQSDKYLF